MFIVVKTGTSPKLEAPQTINKGMNKYIVAYSNYTSWKDKQVHATTWMKLKDTC